VQVEPFVAGQTLNVGEPMFNAADTVAVMTTFAVDACVLHNQTTKPARLPGVTRDVENDCARTHSCGVGGGGVGVELGVGVGVGVAVGVGLALGSGVGVEPAEVSAGLGLVGGVEEGLFGGGGVDEPDCEVLGLAEGLLDDVLAESDGLEVADVLVVARLLGDAEVAVENGDRIDGDPVPEPEALVETLAITTTFVGADAQVVLAVVVLVAVVLPVGAMATFIA